VQDGGLSVTLLDLARFGLMHLERGVADGRQVVPAEWIDRLRRPLPELAEAYAGSLTVEGTTTADTMYHDKWWVLDPGRGIRAGLGIHGQLLLVHEPSRTVVVKLSTLPRPDDDTVLQVELRGALAICEALASGSL
jgi:CubicO group peptidase (beta-lactamase class C family)